MVRRLVGAALLGTVLVLAAGCGGSAKQSAGDTTPKHTFKVGLVTDVGQLNDRGFNHLAFVGLKRAERQLGIHGRVSESRTSARLRPESR